MNKIVFTITNVKEGGMTQLYPALKDLTGIKVTSSEKCTVEELMDGDKIKIIQYLKEDASHTIRDVVEDVTEMSYEVESLDDLQRLSSAVDDEELIINFKAKKIIIYDSYME